MREGIITIPMISIGCLLETTTKPVLPMRFHLVFFHHM